MEKVQEQNFSKESDSSVFSTDLSSLKDDSINMFKIINHQNPSQLLDIQQLNSILDHEVQETKLITIGTEIELLVLNNKFYEANKAQKVLDLTKKQNKSFFVEECSQCNVEFVGSPNNLKGVITELTQQLKELDDVAKTEGILLAPIDFPLNVNFEPQITNHSRYINKEKIMEKAKFDICKKSLGIHFHFDLDSRAEIKINQLNFLALFDPLAIIATATSRQFLKGILINNWRVYAYRYLAHKDFPFQGDIQQLYANYEEYSEKLTDEYNKFLGISLLKGIDFSKNSSKENAIWGPVRINPKYNTVELRSMSSHPDMVTVMSAAALASGGIRQIVKNEVNMQNLYELLTGTTDLNKASEYLKKIDHEAALYGFKSEEVVTYCNKLLLFCINGLEGKEIELVKAGLQKFWKKTNYVESIILDSIPNEKKYEILYDVYIKSLQELKDMWVE